MGLEIIYDKVEDREYSNCWSAETIADCNLVTKSSPAIALTTSANTPNPTFDWVIETIAKNWITGTGLLNNGLQRAKGITTVDTTKYERVCVNGVWSIWVASNPNVNVTNDRIYQGVDLSIKFASEIAGYSDVWAWIKARTQAANFTGIHVGDYIPFNLSAGTVASYTISAQSFKAQIVSIDTYWGYGDTTIGHHIDFITKTCMDTAIQWQPNDNNNGTVEQANPWLSSKLYAVLNGVNNYSTNAYNSVVHGVDASAGGILQLLPTTLQNAIIQKRQVLEIRYSIGGLLTTSNSSTWTDIGKLWLPNELEVYGTQIWSHVYSNGNAVQYPLFAGAAGYKGRLKTNSSGSRVTWWLAVAHSGSSTFACNVNSNGNANNNSCSNSGIYVPLCFRIG